MTKNNIYKNGLILFYHKDSKNAFTVDNKIHLPRSCPWWRRHSWCHPLGALDAAQGCGWHPWAGRCQRAEYPAELPRTFWVASQQHSGAICCFLFTLWGLFLYLECNAKCQKRRLIRRNDNSLFFFGILF